MDFPRPRIVVSKCLGFEACRYNGQKIQDQTVELLQPFVEFVPVCPEVEIGLGVPRDTIRLVTTDSGETRLVQPSTDRDLTEPMGRFADSFLDGLGPVDGFVLKNGSPTCGTSAVKVYESAEPSPPVRKEAGMFAREVLDRFDELAIEDEGRLRNFPIRHHFLTRLFALADLRALGAVERLEVAELVDFHRRYKHLLMVYHEERMRQLGRIVANPEARSGEELFADYAPLFRRALAAMPSRPTHVNAIMHMYGHFKGQLSQGERDQFHEMIEEFRDHQLPMSALLVLLRSWCARYDYDYLADQRYLNPYPRQLIQMRDSGKGIDF